jgi:hypothetical protein
MGAMTIGAAEFQAAPVPAHSPWDTSWLDALASAQFRVVFNANEINDGIVMDQVRMFLDHFHEVHGTIDAQTRAVIVFRRLGAPMAFNDAMWDRYAIGEDIRIAEPGTRRASEAERVLARDGGRLTAGRRAAARDSPAARGNQPRLLDRHEHLGGADRHPPAP